MYNSFLRIANHTLQKRRIFLNHVYPKGSWYFRSLFCSHQPTEAPQSRCLVRACSPPPAAHRAFCYSMVCIYIYIYIYMYIYIYQNREKRNLFFVFSMCWHSWISIRCSECHPSTQVASCRYLKKSDMTSIALWCVESGSAARQSRHSMHLQG